MTKQVTHINENASVTLKPWNKNDAAALANIADNKKIFMQVRDSFPQPYTLTDALKWIDAHLQTSKATNFAIWYNNELAGSIGYVPQENERRHIAEIGYFIGEVFWGKQIATKAVEQLLQLIQEQQKFYRIEAYVFEKNVASIKVLQKNGFFLEGIQHKAAIKNNEMQNVLVWVKFLTNYKV